MNGKQFVAVRLMVLTVALMIAALLVMPAGAQSPIYLPVDPYPDVAPVVVTFQANTAQDDAATGYTSGALGVRDVLKYRSVTPIISATVTTAFTATAQFSNDGTRYADGVIPVSSGTTITPTYIKAERVLTASGAYAVGSFPIQGQFMRFKMQSTGATSGLAITAILR